MPYPPKAASGSSRHLRYPLLVSAISLSLANLLSVPVKAATIEVNGGCTLVDAITAANSDSATGSCTAGSDADTLVLANSSVHSFTVGTFAGDGNNNALPSITSTITIQGNGATIQRASGSATNFRLFHVEAGGNLTLDHVTLSGGVASAGAYGSDGGALLNRGTVTLNSSTVTGNSANSGGGLWNNSGKVTLSNSTVSNNSAIAGGGGLYNQSSTANLSNSTVSGNSASHGGGLANNSSTANLNNSTVSGNSTDWGGGLWNKSSTTKLSNSTVSGNTATTSGGGLYNFSGSIVTLSNSIVANDPVGDDCHNVVDTTFNGADHNWFEDNKCDGTADGDPNLGPLANNGGPTQTHALLAGSGAIDAGNDTVCNAAPVNGKDQRGIKRPQGAHCDIGAYEYKDETSFFVIPLNNGKSVIFGL